MPYPSLDTARAALDRSTLPGPWLIAGDSERGFAIYHARYHDMVPAGWPIAATIPPDLDPTSP